MPRSANSAASARPTTYRTRFEARDRSAFVRPSPVRYESRKLWRIRPLHSTSSKSALPVVWPPRLTISSLGTVWQPKQAAASSYTCAERRMPAAVLSAMRRSRCSAVSRGAAAWKSASGTP